MNLTKKTVKTEVETIETVCEITKEELADVGAQIASDIVMSKIGDELDVHDMVMGLAMASVLAEFMARLELKLFGDTDEDKNPKTKEEK